MKISKKQFCSLMKGLKKQYKKDRSFAKSLERYTEKDSIIIVNNHLACVVINFLKKITDDDTEYSDIDYFIYELDFGKKYKDGCYTQYDKNIVLKTPSDLWDQLKKNYKPKKDDEDNDERDKLWKFIINKN